MMANIDILPENPLWGKEITVKIGDTIRFGLYGIWKQDDESFPETNVKPLKLEGSSIPDSDTKNHVLDTKKTGFLFLARATGKCVLTFTSGGEGIKLVKKITVIVAK
jgi:hypothetical protein